MALHFFVLAACDLDFLEGSTKTKYEHFLVLLTN